MPYKLELYSGNRAILVNSETGHHFSTNPIPKKRAESQMRLLQMIERSPEYKKRKK
jgi:hypothetical protein